MTRGAVLRLFSVLAVCSQGLTAVIQTQQTVLAAVGEEARFSCQLLVSKDVLQVTWQKLLPDREENLATYSKYFGQRVNPDFTDNVEFKNIGLQNCSIVIRNVTDQDEGCYYCLFNTYPEGSFRGRTCLQVYELHDPVLHMRESNSTAELTVSCSATGRPAPTVTLSVSQQDLSFSHNNTVSVSNTNGTFTVTTTAVLSGSHENRTQVGCAVRVLFAPQKEAFVTLPDVKRMPDNDDDFPWIILLSVVAVIAFLLVLVACCWVITPRLKQQNKKRDPEENTIETPRNSDRAVAGTHTPVIKENETIRQ